MLLSRHVFNDIFEDDDIKIIFEPADESLVINILADEIHLACFVFISHQYLGIFYACIGKVYTHALAATVRKGAQHAAFGGTHLQHIDAGAEWLGLFYKRQYVGTRVIHLLVEAYFIVYMVL